MTDELKQWEYDKGYEKGHADGFQEALTDAGIVIYTNKLKADGAREFAEWLANGCTFMRRLGEDDMYTVNELISKWEKSKEYG